MEYTMSPELAPATIDRVAGRYVAVWSEPDPGLRRDAIAGLFTVKPLAAQPSADCS